MSEPPVSVSVLVVDDSAFMRRVISDMVGRYPGYRVVGTARDGRAALRAIRELDPDVVTLDIEMPGLDGFGVLKEVMAKEPRPVVVLSAHTDDGSRAALRALDLGAVDFVPKPSGTASLNMGSVEGRLYKALRAAAAADMGSLVDRVEAVRRSVDEPEIAEPAVVVVAASTGGPRALSHIIQSLPGNLGAALLIVQHMPPGFTNTLAARLDALGSLSVSEAVGGEAIVPNRAWVAPGGFHMRVRCEGEATRLFLDQREPIWGTRPAADALFTSAAEAFGHRCVGVVLTGMGRDGTAGLAAIREAGGRTLVQDRQSSVVYGMPGYAMTSGVAEREVPLSEVGDAIVGCLVSMGRARAGKTG